MPRSVETTTETKTYMVREIKVSCDKCGRPVDQDPEDEDLYHQELLIYLNPELCVRSSFRRDYCRACLLPIWNLICGAIGADPDDISNSDFDDGF
jgi:hypothetical protein